MKTINRIILSICVLLAMEGCHKDNTIEEDMTPRIIWTQTENTPDSVDIVAHYSDGSLLFFKLVNDTIAEDELICVGNRFSFEDSPNGNYDLVIPETIIANPLCDDNYDYYYELPKTFSVTRIGRAGEYSDNLFDHRITSLTIPNTVKTIEEGCFMDYSSLSSIVFSTGLETIGSRAFMGCSSLNSVVFPAGLDTIGSGAFECCNSLAEITLPGSIQKVEYGAFGGCTSLHSVIIQPGMSTIPESTFSGAFGRCNYIGDDEYEDASIALYFPEGLRIIERDAFKDCSSLTEISFPTTIQHVDDWAFDDCYSLRVVTIQPGIDTIPRRTFEHVFSEYHGMSEVSLSLPEGLEVIGNGAFYHCNSLVSLSLPEGLEVIGNGAFYHCNSLVSLSLPEGLKIIGIDAFSECNSLVSLILPEGLEVIGRGAFKSCNSLAVCTCYATIPPTMEYSFYYPFGTSLRAIYVPGESVEAYKIADFWREYADIIYPIE